jgi:Gpi18-like mannosyltransferase
MEAAFFGLSRISDLRSGGRDLFFYFGCAFALYLVLVTYIRFLWSRSFFSPELIVVAAIVFRVTLLFSQPVLSDDVYRYVWDGRVANAGINPYQYSPDADNLIGLRDSTVYPLVNHKEIPTIYPPVLQVVFRVVTVLSESVWAMKAAMILADFGTILTLLALLRFLGRAVGWVAVYAWNPLVVVEVAGSGHADAVYVFLLTLSIYFAIRARTLQAGFLLGLSFLTKFASVLLLPFLEDIRSRFKTWALAAGVFAAVVLLVYWPFSTNQVSAFVALSAYLERWEFNSSVYGVVYRLLEEEMADDPNPHEWLGFWTDNKPRLVTKWMSASVLMLTTVWMLWKQSRRPFQAQKEGLPHAAFILIGCTLVVSPTVHPWYVTWIVPFLCVVPNLAWILFTGLVFLSYDAAVQFADTGRWTEDRALVFWEYLPFYAILVGTLAWKAFKSLKAHPAEAS